MKVLKQLLFAVAMTICISLSVSAQQKPDDKKNTPPKTNVPVIPLVPKERPRENDRPKDDKKKPETAYLKPSNTDETAAA